MGDMGNKTCSNCFDDDKEIEFRNEINRLDNGVKNDRDVTMMQQQNTNQI